MSQTMKPVRKAKWWESSGGFFGKYYKEADNSLEGHLNNPMHLTERTMHEVDGVLTLANIGSSGCIMDCPSGYGRHSLELARRGYEVTGVDINKEFLSIAEEGRKELNLHNCRFVEQDMRTLNYNNKFDLVINLFYSFGFFDTDEENEKVAKNFYNALRYEGKFVMHTHVTVPRLLNGSLKNNQIRRLKSGNKLKLNRHYNAETKREDGVWEVLNKNNKSVQLTPYSVRIYTEDEFKKLCIGVGFRDIKFYGSWSKDQYTVTSPEMIAIAVK